MCVEKDDSGNVVARLSVKAAKEILVELFVQGDAAEQRKLHPNRSNPAQTFLR